MGNKNSSRVGPRRNDPRVIRDIINENKLAAENRNDGGDKIDDEMEDLEVYAECVICLDSIPPSDRAELGCCTDTICKGCLSSHLNTCIVDSHMAFPPCPGCDDILAAKIVRDGAFDKTVARFEKLRGTYISKVSDRRYIWCISEQCDELLPPSDEDDIDDDIKDCPACLTSACIRCGGAAHRKGNCIPEEQQRRILYARYAVGRISLCTHCGVHIERSRGCDHMYCTKCNSEFVFDPFRSVAQVMQSLAKIHGPPGEKKVLPKRDARDRFTGSSSSRAPSRRFFQLGGRGPRGRPRGLGRTHGAIYRQGPREGYENPYGY